MVEVGFQKALSRRPLKSSTRVKVSIAGSPIMEST